MQGVDNQSSVAVKSLIKHALDSRASDIHIEPTGSSQSVRYRVDGVLKNAEQLPQLDTQTLATEIKSLAGLEQDASHTPQNGQYNYKTEEQTVNLRISTLPVVGGERIVIHLQDETNPPLSLKDLGLQGENLTQIEKALAQPHGLILVAGPIGSGKSTTLYSLLESIKNSNIHIATIEEQVERRLTGVSQTLANHRGGLTTAEAIKALLSQDANVIMVSDVKDSETAKVVVDTARSHLVLAGISVNNAVGCLPYFTNLGIEPYLLASVLQLVIGQRLVRKIDPKNFTQNTPSEEEVTQIGKEFLITSEPEWDKIFKVVVQFNTDKPAITKKNFFLCKPMGDTGEQFSGRTAVFEVLVNSPEIQKMITSLASSEDIQKQAVEEEMIPIELDGLCKALAGQTTISEVKRVLQI